MTTAQEQTQHLALHLSNRKEYLSWRDGADELVDSANPLNSVVDQIAGGSAIPNISTGAVVSDRPTVTDAGKCYVVTPDST